MASPLNMLTQSNIIPKKVSKTSIERIVDALNPYTASPNIRLILDMVAYKYVMYIGCPLAVNGNFFALWRYIITFLKLTVNFQILNFKFFLKLIVKWIPY